MPNPEDPDDVDMTIEYNGEEVTPNELADRIRPAITDLLERSGEQAPDEMDPLVLPARDIALAWLAVQLAAGEDKDRHAIYRRVHVEVHSYGVTLSATDSYWLARAFVPFDGEHESWSPPTLDEIAPWSFTVADIEHRIRDLFRYVERATRREDTDDYVPRIEHVLITRTDDYDPDVPTLDPSLSAPIVRVDLPGEERIIARESEIAFPNLNKLAKFQPQTARHMLFNPTLISRVASACQRIGSAGMRLTPTTAGSVGWEAESERDLSGILMPLRDDTEEVPT